MCSGKHTYWDSVNKTYIYESILNSTRDPVYREEEEAFESWWSKTPLGRRRQRFLELEEERLIEEQAQQAKQGNGNKKKV